MVGASPEKVNVGQIREQTRDTTTYRVSGTGYWYQNQ